jgi:hypothetical protein
VCARTSALLLYGGMRVWVGRASAQQQPWRQPQLALVDDEVGGGGRLAPGSPWGSRPGQGEEVGLVVCKLGGRAVGET